MPVPARRESRCVSPSKPEKPGLVAAIGWAAGAGSVAPGAGAPVGMSRPASASIVGANSPPVATVPVAPLDAAVPTKLRWRATPMLGAALAGRVLLWKTKNPPTTSARIAAALSPSRSERLEIRMSTFSHEKTWYEPPRDGDASEHTYSDARAARKGGRGARNIRANARNVARPAAHSRGLMGVACMWPEVEICQ